MDGLAGPSGMWPTMHTNTSRILTAFSDLPHDSDLVFPSNRVVLEYLHRYAEMFDLSCALGFGTVRQGHPAGEGTSPAGSSNTTGRAESFDRVVVASGRFQAPAQSPSVPGLDTFAGSGGRDVDLSPPATPDRYRGKRVLVAGCAVSSLEIASELAQSGAARVVVTRRRQRYVLPKFAAGVPSDHRIFTRYGLLANEALPPAEVELHQLREIVVEAGGSPEQYGAPAPNPSLFAAGVTLSQQYLPLVAEGRITIRPWLTSVSEDPTVTFSDGETEAFDGILFGTGFQIEPPVPE